MKSQNRLKNDAIQSNCMGFKGAIVGVLIGLLIYGVLMSVYLSSFSTLPCTFPDDKLGKCPPLAFDNFFTYFINSYLLFGGQNVFVFYLLFILILVGVIAGYLLIDF